MPVPKNLQNKTIAQYYKACADVMNPGQLPKDFPRINPWDYLYEEQGRQITELTSLERRYFLQTCLTPLFKYAQKNNLTRLEAQILEDILSCLSILKNEYFLNPELLPWVKENHPQETQLISYLSAETINLMDIFALAMANISIFNSSTITFNKTVELYLIVAILLVKAGFSRECILPELIQNLEVGAQGHPIEDVDINDLAFLRNTEETFRVVMQSEVIDFLEKKQRFINPLSQEALTQIEITSLLQHSKVQGALKRLHTSELEKLKTRETQAPYIAIKIEKIVSKLTEFGQALWKASTHNEEDRVFRENDVNKAVDDFLAFIQSIQEDCPDVIEVLNQRSYYIGERRDYTTFTQLYSNMTFNGCSAQLGIAIKQWVEKYREEKSAIIEATLAEKTAFSLYIKAIPPDVIKACPQLTSQAPAGGRYDNDVIYLSILFHEIPLKYFFDFNLTQLDLLQHAIETERFDIVGELLRTDGIRDLLTSNLGKSEIIYYLLNIYGANNDLIQQYLSLLDASVPVVEPLSWLLMKIKPEDFISQEWKMNIGHLMKFINSANTAEQVQSLLEAFKQPLTTGIFEGATGLYCLSRALNNAIVTKFPVEQITACAAPIMALIEKADTLRQVQSLLEAFKQPVTTGDFKGATGVYYLSAALSNAVANKFSAKQINTCAAPIMVLIEKADTPRQVQSLLEAFKQPVTTGDFKGVTGLYCLSRALNNAVLTKLPVEQITACAAPIMTLIEKADTLRQVQSLLEAFKQSETTGVFKGATGLFWLSRALNNAIVTKLSVEQITACAAPIMTLIEKANTPRQVQSLLEAFKQPVAAGIFEGATGLFWLSRALNNAIVTKLSVEQITACAAPLMELINKLSAVRGRWKLDLTEQQGKAVTKIYQRSLLQKIFASEIGLSEMVTILNMEKSKIGLLKYLRVRTFVNDVFLFAKSLADIVERTPGNAMQNILDFVKSEFSLSSRQRFNFINTKPQMPPALQGLYDKNPDELKSAIEGFSYDAMKGVAYGWKGCLIVKTLKESLALANNQNAIMQQDLRPARLS